MTLAVYVRPEVTSCAETLVDWSMTWLLVSTRPLDEMTIPVPSAVAPLYLRSEVMSTRPGSTLADSELAFSEPVPLLVPPELPLPLDPKPPKPPPPNGFVAVPPPLPVPPLPVPPTPLPPTPVPLLPVGASAVGVPESWLSATATPAPAPAAST